MDYMKKFLNLTFVFVLFVWISLASSIWDVDVSFCNLDWWQNNSLSFAIESGLPYEFCLEFVNNSQESVLLDLDFVDVEETNDAFRNKACSAQWEFFGKMVKMESKELSLLWWEKLQKTGLITILAWYSGKLEWCLVYSLAKGKDSLAWDSLFDVIVRKAKFIDAYAVGDFDRKWPEYLWTNYVYNSENKRLLVAMDFQNDWDIPELLQYTWYLKNPLWYTKTISSSAILKANDKNFISIYFDNIPFYKGLYNFEFEWISILDPDLDLSYIPDDLKEYLKFSHKKTIFVMPWNIVLYLFGSFLLLRLIRMILKLTWKK